MPKVRVRRVIRVLIAGGILLAVVLGWSSSVSAHPLGNFTVNRYARIEASAGMLRIYYVLDEAEIPAFQERNDIRANRNGFLRRRVAEIAGNLRLTIDGERQVIRPTAQSMNEPPGQGGLDTLRVAAIFESALPPGPPGQKRVLTFADRNEPDRIGWREIVAVARSDARLLSSNAPTRDSSDELRHYPANLIQAPLDLRQVTVSFTPGSRPFAGERVPSSAAAPTRSGGSFTSLITRQHLTPAVLAGMYGLALLVGAGHALLPGHGKTIMAAYLIGTKGRPVDAILLGVIVSLMHTASVLTLGLVLFKVSRSVSVERIYPQLTAASGVLAMAFGAWLFLTRARGMRRPSPATHTHQEHVTCHHDLDLLQDTGPRRAQDYASVAAAGVIRLEHSSGNVALRTHLGHNNDEHGPVHRHTVSAEDNGHHHHHGPGSHTHDLPDDVAPLSRRGLIILATSGGIVPSPSAVIVVVSAFSIGRVVLGLSLIAAFSVGLAVTLTAVGLALVFGRSLIDRRWPNRSLHYLPLLGAAALILAGAVLAVRGLTSIA